jgi:hypothetical protein
MGKKGTREEHKNSESHHGQGHLHAYMCRVGQNHIYTVYIRYFWQGNHQIYDYIRCIYTVLANPIHVWSRGAMRVWCFTHQ